MANRFAVASGNFNDTATWSTTAAGSPGASVPVAGDNAIANNRTVTITANAICDNITNGLAYGGTPGGNFTLSNGVTLTANVVAGSAASTAVVNLTSPNSASIVGNLTGGIGLSAHAVSTTGNLSVTGNIAGGNGSNALGIAVSSPGSVSVSGNVTGGFGTNSSLPNYGIQISSGSAASVSVTNGNVTGGSGVIAHGIHSLNPTGSISVIGNIIGSSSSAGAGINNGSTGSVNVTGNVTSSNAAGIINATTGSLTISGTLTSSNSAHALTCTNQTSASVDISGSLISSPQGLLPTNCAKFRVNPTPSTAFVRFAKNGTTTYSDFFTADNTGLGPATNHVRSGVTYSGMVGTLAVPLPSQVAVGVATDNTVGTALVTGADIATAVWGAATRSITGGTVDTLTNAPASVTPSDIWSHASRTVTGGTVDTLTNAPSVPSASAIASQVRSELSVELSRIDAATSTRATPANIPTSEISAIKGKTDLLNTTRLAQVSTTEILGNLLAQANS